jgi:N-formylglutamate deformylase
MASPAAGIETTFRLRRGNSPLVVSMPHVGTGIPESLLPRLTLEALRRPDTDWHLARLYDFLGDLDATVIEATMSRYVVDLNRPPDDANLYPGHDSTGLVPVDTFRREPLYRDAKAPDHAEIAQRVDRYWRPYHRRLEDEIARVRSEHGVAVLWDAHSIVSRAPRFFAGTLADFNLGTAGGTSCDAALARRLHEALCGHAAYRAVLDARFKGGHITRRYGQPARNIHAIQLEMAQAIYMDEECPFGFRSDLAASVRPILREQLEIALAWARLAAA